MADATGAAAHAAAGAAGSPAGGAGGDVSEGTQALLDRPERLGDMRDRGLLTEEEAEAAKGPIVAELESRS